MEKVVRFGVSMNGSLARRFDAMVKRRGYDNRSEAVRDMVRRDLIREEWEDPNSEIVGTITLVYDHRIRELGDRLIDIQHDHHDLVISTTHVHLTHEHCLEVLVVRGRARSVSRLADRVVAVRGVLHGQLVATTTGKVFKAGATGHKRIH
ncbi:MAG: nickel-responsive transcriptional regulator NikR [Planctomycetes bacterium]|nr:nickel-responsive transcriptional regulator NikR [Planctomycetota bacterium]